MTRSLHRTSLPTATWVTLVFALMVFVTPAHAVNYFVRKTGSDTNPGTSKTAAFLTIQRALTAANAGDIIYVGAGSYTENLTTVRAGSSVTAQIQLTGDTAGTQTGDAGTINIEASGSNTALRVNHAHFRVASVTIRAGTDSVVWNSTNGVMATVTVRDGTDDGLELLANATLTTTGCNFLAATDNNIVVNATAQLSATAGTMRQSMTTGAGIAVLGAGSVVTLNRVKIYANATQGMLVQRGTVTMTNCQVYDNKSGGIRVEGFNTSSGGTITTNTTVNIVNNTLDENLGAPAIWIRDATYRIINNCITYHSIGVELTSTESPTLNVNNAWGNNIYFGNSTNVVGDTTDSTDVFLDPGYINRGNNNFTTLAASGATDMGRAANAYTTIDFSNRVRPSNAIYDIGAYEAGGLIGTIPYFRDFQSALTSEWSDTTRTTIANANVTTYKGPHSNAGTTAQVTTVWLTTTVGQDYSIFFDLLGLALLDGANTTNGPDLFEVLVDGSIMWRESVTQYRNGYPQSIVDTPEYHDSSYAIYRGIEVPFTAENTLTAISFNAACNQGWTDEGFGIDNFRVVTAATAATFRFPFRDVAIGTPFAQVARGGGLHSADVNLDGRPDAIVLGQASRLLLSSGINAWTSTTLNANAYLSQGAIADVDSNGAPDFLALRTNHAEEFFASRANAGVFSGYWQGSPISLGATVSGNAASVAAGDTNADGLIDFVLTTSTGNSLAIATPTTIASGWTLATFFPDGLYSYVPTQTGIPNGTADRGAGNRITAGDVNNDGYPDFFYLYNGGRLFLSNADGTYTTNNRGITTTGTVLNASWADYDNDGDLDLFFGTSNGGSAMRLWRSPGATGNFTNVATTVGLNLTTRVSSSSWGDFDNDGDLDLYVIGNNTQAQLYVNSGAPNYTFLATERGASTVSEIADCTFTDYDLDGDLDIAVTNASNQAYFANRFFENTPTANQSNYLIVRVVGRGLRGINRLAIGTRVELWNSADTTFLQRRDIGNARGNGQDPLLLHFGGVSPATTYTLRVYRPNGTRYAVQVTPATASTTIAGRTIPQMYTFDEEVLYPIVQVVRWHEVGEDE